MPLFRSPRSRFGEEWPTASRSIYSFSLFFFSLSLFLSFSLTLVLSFSRFLSPSLSLFLCSLFPYLSRPACKLKALIINYTHTGAPCKQVAASDKESKGKRRGKKRGEEGQCGLDRVPRHYCRDLWRPRMHLSSLCPLQDLLKTESCYEPLFHLQWKSHYSTFLIAEPQLMAWQLRTLQTLGLSMRKMVFDWPHFGKKSMYIGRLVWDISLNTVPGELKSTALEADALEI